MECKNCGAVGLRLTWQTFANKTKHIRSDCSACGKFSHYVPQSPEATVEADANRQANNENDDKKSLFEDVT